MIYPIKQFLGVNCWGISPRGSYTRMHMLCKITSFQKTLKKENGVLFCCVRNGSTGAKLSEHLWEWGSRAGPKLPSCQNGYLQNCDICYFQYQLGKPTGSPLCIASGYGAVSRGHGSTCFLRCYE